MMLALRTIIGSVVGCLLNLLVFRLIPITPDLSDWGGRGYPRTYIFPLLIVAVISYLTGWIGSKFSPRTGRICGMFASILTGAVIIGWGFSPDLITPLFHHPAYPVFSDHALLALAVLLAGGHLGGARVEKVASATTENDLIASNPAST